MLAILVFFQIVSPEGGYLLYVGSSGPMTVEECIERASTYNTENFPRGAVALCAPSTSE